jgi:hypothetical protein
MITACHPTHCPFSGQVDQALKRDGRNDKAGIRITRWSAGSRMFDVFRKPGAQVPKRGVLSNFPTSQLRLSRSLQCPALFSSAYAEAHEQSFFTVPKM